MEFVVKDTDVDWYYENKTYWGINPKGEKIKKLYAKYVPDPYKLWESKIQTAGLEKGTEGANALKPTQVTFKLWEHVNVNNND